MFLSTKAPAILATTALMILRNQLSERVWGTSWGQYPGDRRPTAPTAWARVESPPTTSSSQATGDDAPPRTSSPPSASGRTVEGSNGDRRHWRQHLG